MSCQRCRIDNRRLAPVLVLLCTWNFEQLLNAESLRGLLNLRQGCDVLFANHGQTLDKFSEFVRRTLLFHVLLPLRSYQS